MKGDLAVCSDGLHVWASLPGDGAPRLRFGDDMVIPIPEASNGLAAALTGAGHIAVVRGHNDHAFSVTRSRNIQRLGNCIGTNSVGIIPRGDIFWIANTREYKRLWQSVVSTLPVPTDASGQGISGQGWTQIWDSGEIRWTDKVGTQRIDGKLLTRVVELGLWKIGMDTSKPRILAYFATDKSWWLVANTTTQSGPQAVLVNGQPWVAISGEQCFVVKREQFTRIALATPLPSNPDTDEDADMTDAQVRDLFARLTRIERAVADLQEDFDELVEDGIHPAPPTDPPPSADEPAIDVDAVTWLGKASPLGFPVTAGLTSVTITKKADDGSTPYRDDHFEVCFSHTNATEWPAYDNGSGVIYDRNICVFGFLNGQWYGDTAEVVKVGRNCKRLSNRPERDSWGIGPHTKHEPLRSWGPKSGEWIGVMVCTPVREGIKGDVNERSQILMVRWP